MHRCVPIALAVVVLSAPACTSRPVAAISPTTKVSFTALDQQSAIDKVDLLFMIDNSLSMGDKQAYLEAAIPDLLARLVSPNCVDPANPSTVYGTSDADGNCAQGKAEFKPVHDLHIGIVTSSLGARAGDICPSTTPDDDQAHLVNRTAAGPPVGAAEPSGFLEWFPSLAANDGVTPGAGATPITDLPTLEQDFQDMIGGVGETGCGIESQLESWYRFLVQPDPYAELAPDGNGQPQWSGVDATILRERHDFLRPDSLVAVIDLTDENDSEIDVRAFGGKAVAFMQKGELLSRGTSACATNPDDPSCTSCGDCANAASSSDPSCKLGCYSASNDWGFDPNLRHVHMKAKYGVDPQYPVARYTNGLTSSTVPDRAGEYPSGAADYVGTPDCTNPLFAATLPDGSNLDPATLCNLPRGSRVPDRIFYAHIGGVPSDLLHYDPTNAAQSVLSDADWTRILGADPAHYDTSGIDPRMIEAYAPTRGVAGDWTTTDGSLNGISLAVDLEYACTFPISPRDCSNPANRNVCDCPSSPTRADGTAVPKEEIPPVCNPSDVTKQVAAKSYPTIRELYLAKLLGQQGIAASICPIHVSEQSPGDPLYGYRPAVATIVDRLKTALAGQCVPHPLAPDANGDVPCLVLATLPTAGDEEASCDRPDLGLSVPDPDVLARAQARSGASFPICAVNQLVVPSGQSCAGGTQPGWCYVTGAGSCPQSIAFARPDVQPAGSLVSMLCIEPSQ